MSPKPRKKPSIVAHANHPIAQEVQTRGSLGFSESQETLSQRFRWRVTETDTRTCLGERREGDSLQMESSQCFHLDLVLPGSPCQGALEAWGSIQNLVTFS